MLNRCDFQGGRKARVEAVRKGEERERRISGVSFPYEKSSSENVGREKEGLGKNKREIGPEKEGAPT